MSGQRIKVVMLAPHPIEYEKEKIHGVSEVVVRLSENIVKNHNIDLTIISIVKEISTVRHIDTFPYPVIVLPEDSISRFINCYRKELGIINDIVNKINPDIVHAQGLPEYLLAAYNANRPWVFTVHGIAQREFWVESGFNTRIHMAYRGIIEKMFYSKIRNLISISSYVDKVFENKNANIFRINNPINESFFNLQRNVVKGKIIFVGSIGRRKGIQYLLEGFSIASKRVEGIKLLLIGTYANTQIKKYVDDFIRRNKLESSIRILGRIGTEELLSHYQTAHVLCLPSLEETSPMVIAQALAARLPVIATDVGGIPEMVIRNKTGIIVEPRNSSQISDGIINVIENDVFSNPSNYVDISHHYHPQYVADQTIHAYKKILTM